MDRKGYENHLRVNILGSGAIGQCILEAEERGAAGSPLKPRDQGEREVHLREILLRYWDKQQAWLKKVEPYTFRMTGVRNSYFLLQFDSAEMADLWRRDAAMVGIYLWDRGSGQTANLIIDAENFYLPLMTWTNIDTLMNYLRKVW